MPEKNERKKTKKKLLNRENWHFKGNSQGNKSKERINRRTFMGSFVFINTSHNIAGGRNCFFFKVGIQKKKNPKFEIFKNNSKPIYSPPLLWFNTNHHSQSHSDVILQYYPIMHLLIHFCTFIFHNI
jgi:hypothetical protein